MRTESRDRETALKFIYEREANDEMLSSMSDYEHFMTYFGSFANSGLCKKLCLGTLNNLQKVDKIIESYADNWKISRMNAVDRSLLRVGVYELLGLSTPRKVVINEIVELAKRYGTNKSKCFINGILHNVAQDKEKYTWQKNL